MTAEKPTKSKKFIASQVFSIGWIVLIGGEVALNGFLIYEEKEVAVEWGLLAAQIGILGGLQFLYIGGQAALDAYTRGFSKVLSQTAGKTLPELPPEQDTEEL